MCGNGISHFAEYPKHDTEDLVKEIKKVKSGKSKNSDGIRSIAMSIIRDTPCASDCVSKILDYYGFQGIID